MGTKPLETLKRPVIDGAPITRSGNTNAWAGRTTLSSGSSSVTVSTAVVNSDSIILVTPQVGSVSAVISYTSQIVVNSIVSGTSFMLAAGNGQTVPWDRTLMWMVWRTS